MLIPHDPNGKVRPLPPRFKKKFFVTQCGCWLWTGSTNRHGYGTIKRRGGRWKDIYMAHRFAYIWLVGAIPDGLVLDHLCRVRCCVNPEHVEPVTLQENFDRGIGRNPDIDMSQEIDWTD